MDNWLIVLIVIFILFAYPLFRFLRWFIDPLYVSLFDTTAIHYSHQFKDPISNTTSAALQTLFQEKIAGETIDLSLIVPAYNEEERLGIMLDDTLRYLQAKEKKSSGSVSAASNSKSPSPASFRWEIIVVDDGSSDRTSEKALSYTKKFGVDRIRVLTLKVNQGKGGAVQQGMIHARGQMLLFLDADGATKIDDFDKLQSEYDNLRLSSNYAVVIGSRAHLEEEALAKRSLIRNILMRGFHLAVFIFGVRGIRDTQCGFKLFSRSSAQYLFYNQHLRRWCFDVELLYLAKLKNMNIKEVAVNWTEIPGSKMSLLKASLMMARDLIIIRIAYLFGIWTAKDPKNYMEIVARKDK